MKLVDIETNNGLCTWNNKRGGDSQVSSKLDRFIIFEDLMLLDKEIIVGILPFGGSDHWPFKWRSRELVPQETNLSDLKIFGFHTQNSSATLKNGG